MDYKITIVGNKVKHFITTTTTENVPENYLNGRIMDTGYSLWPAKSLMAFLKDNNMDAGTIRVIALDYTVATFRTNEYGRVIVDGIIEGRAKYRTTELDTLNTYLNRLENVGYEFTHEYDYYWFASGRGLDSFPVIVLKRGDNKKENAYWFARN